MPHLFLKQIPKYECLLESSKLHPELNPKACEAFIHLLHASDEIVRRFSGFFHNRGLSQGRFVVLHLLHNKLSSFKSPSTPAELADLCVCTRATMTGLIDTLEKDGLVRREPDSEDRRVMRVRITEAGAELMDRILPEHFRNITAMMSVLSPDEQKVLVQLLGKIVQQAEPRSPDEGSRGEP